MENSTPTMSRFFLPNKVWRIFGLKIFSTVFLCMRNFEKKLQQINEFVIFCIKYLFDITHSYFHWVWAIVLEYQWSFPCLFKMMHTYHLSHTFQRLMTDIFFPHSGTCMRFPAHWHHFHSPYGRFLRNTKQYAWYHT